jgi:tetratricopeptide (TPR) repeat protein
VTRLAIALGLLVAVGGARADLEDRNARARAYFEAGRALYSLGDYPSALREFTAGYQLVQKPEFLIDLGQTYRRLEQPDKAREMFQLFLATAPPAHPDRRQVASLLDEVSPRSPGASPPTSTEPPPPTRSEATTTTRSVTPAAPATSAPTASAAPARSHHVLLWLLPVAAVLLAGAAVGLYFALRPAPQVGCGDAGLGCIAPGM